MKVKKLPGFKIPKFHPDKHIPIILILLLVIGIGYFFFNTKIGSFKQQVRNLTSQVGNLATEKDKNYQDLMALSAELEVLKNVDQKKRNDELEGNIKSIEKTYDRSVLLYEDLLELKAKIKDSKSYDELFSKSLSQLTKRDYGAAEATLNELATKIKEENAKIAASFSIPATVPESNTPPGAGYSRQIVNTDSGNFLVYIIAADLSETKVVIDTASESNCTNDCPTLPLATYISRSGAYAGIHGAYACPAEYPSCSGKTNSFDLLVMNKNKYYFNSDNNVYSVNPGVIFGNGWVRFVEHASEWGRDTSVDGVISNFPLLVFNKSLRYEEPGDNKMSIKSSRGFVANKGNTVYIGVVFNATVADSAKVLHTMGMDNAMNLDGGGSTALWSGGYKAGPGRNLTNVILFLRK